MWAFLFPHHWGLTCTRSDWLHLSCLWHVVLIWASANSSYTYSLGVLPKLCKRMRKLLQRIRMVFFIALNLNHLFYNLLLRSTWTSSVATSSIWCPFPQKWGVVGANHSWRQGAYQSWRLAQLKCPGGAQDLFLAMLPLAVQAYHGVEGVIGSQSWKRTFFVLWKCGI